MSPWLWKTLYYIIVIPVFLSLPFIYLVPKPQRITFLEYCSPLLEPLTIYMLFPGLYKGEPVFIESNLDHDDSDRLLFMFGGNSNTSAQAREILKGVEFLDHTTADVNAMPNVTVPLQLHRHQRAYIDAIEKQIVAYIERFPNLKQVYIAGHSLGGAIALQLMLRLSEKYPHLHFSMSLDRTFSKLWDVANFRYGKMAAELMRETFGLLWEFDSVAALNQLETRPNVDCHFFQMRPDRILGPDALLTPEILRTHRPLPLIWSVHDEDIDIENPELSDRQRRSLHGMPHEELESLPKTHDLRYDKEHNNSGRSAAW